MGGWPDRLEVGIAERMLPGQSRSGDLAVRAAYDGGALVGAIDGLGHGVLAAEAAADAADAVLADPTADPAALMRRVHEALVRTRGVVMTLAWFDLVAARLTWTGVGNVDGRLVRAPGGPAAPTEGPFVRGGVLGHQLPPIRTTTTALGDGDLVVLATDGIASDYGATLAAGGRAQRVADRILATHGRPTDDALVVVVRHRAA